MAEFEPEYLIPAHYPYYIVDITDEETIAQFPQENVPYLRPAYGIDYFINEMQEWIDRNSLSTKILKLRPGEEHNLE